MIGWLAYNGQSFLVRVDPGTVWLYVPPDLASPQNLSALRAGAAQVTAMARGYANVEVVADRPSGGAVVFDVAIDPTIADRGAAAATERTSENFRVGGGKISYARREYLADFRIARHELGHALGFNHNPDAGVMNANGGYAFSDFTDAEKYALRVMFVRIPGTDWQDDQTRALARSSILRADGLMTTRFVCDFR